jgi:RNA polymerase sigma factor (sigma-70 family)
MAKLYFHFAMLNHPTKYQSTTNENQYYRNGGALFEAFKAGDPLAFRQFYDQIVRPLTYFIENIVLDPIAAEDIAATAFSKIFEGREHYESLEHVKRSIYVIARNSSIDCLREKTKKRTLNDEKEYLDTDWEQVAETERTKAAVLDYFLKEIDNLPPQRQAVIKMKFIEEKTSMQIAKELGLKRQTVLNHLTKALENLRKHLPFVRSMMDVVIIYILTLF